MEGWIKIHRKILEWEYFENDKLFKLWIYMLLSANTEEKRWMGTIIDRGSLVTSQQKLSVVMQCSRRTIQKYLERLKACNQIDYKSSNKNTIISICNYDNYQHGMKEDSHQSSIKVASKSHQSSIKVALLKNNKNKRNINTTTTTIINAHEKKIEGEENILKIQEVGDFLLGQSDGRKSNICRQAGFGIEEYGSKVSEYISHIDSQGSECKERSEVVKHFTNWTRLMSRKDEGAQKPVGGRVRLYAGSAIKGNTEQILAEYYKVGIKDGMLYYARKEDVDRFGDSESKLAELRERL